VLKSIPLHQSIRQNMSNQPPDRTPLWQPSPEREARATLSTYTAWLERTRGRRFSDYEALWRWSTEDLEGFWASIWEFFNVLERHPYSSVLQDGSMPGARWFVDSQLNYVDQLLRYQGGQTPAILYYSEALGSGALSWDELRDQVGAVADTFRRLGVKRGDRVAAYLPNIPHACVAFFAAASIGAVWSVCSPDMGVPAVSDRFRQIAPKLLITCDGYRFGGKEFCREQANRELQALLPTLQAAICVTLLKPSETLGSTGGSGLQFLTWEQAVATRVPLRTEPLPFDHPLWIVYSSGTTGLPKGIVHGHGGALAIGLTMAGLHWDLKPADRFFWHASTGWIMWNLQGMGLLTGSTICLFDGSVTGNRGAPDWLTLWRFVEGREVTFFGSGAAFLASCLKNGVEPNKSLDLKSLTTVGSTGSPLSPDCYRWIYRAVKEDVWLLSTSGGTDIAGSFLTGSPTLPVYEGEIQCRNLGAAVHAFSELGHSVLDEVGELVCTKPMPSMPLYFWGDEDGCRYKESYFDTFKDADGRAIWRHGDWLELRRRPKAIGAVIYGRSDATINRNGIRMGTSELYRVVEALAEIRDSLVVDLEYLGRPSYLGLFVVLSEGQLLTPSLCNEIEEKIKYQLSPRYVPNEILQVEAIPRTLTGKKLEVPIKKLLLGHAVDAVLNPESVDNPASLEWFIEFARRTSPARARSDS
jgi:acetoacetyl-CoA synthetase